MDAFTLLKQDHEKVKKLFRQFEKLGDKAYQKKKDLAEKIFHELSIHTKIEEEIFYPAVKSKASHEGQKLVVEGYEEHRLVKQLMEEIKELAPQDEKYAAKMKVLIENVEHHIKEEQNDMFPKAKKALNGSAKPIGMEMEERKQELEPITE